jgi:hypothetical protein
MSGAAIAELQKITIVEALVEAGPGKRNLETYVVYSREMAGILEAGDEVARFCRAGLAEGR